MLEYVRGIVNDVDTNRYGVPAAPPDWNRNDMLVRGDDVDDVLHTQRATGRDRDFFVMTLEAGSERRRAIAAMHGRVGKSRGSMSSG